MPHWTTTGALVSICCGLTLFYIGRRVLATPKSHPLPPGPPGLPWIGNVFGIDPNAPWVTYAEWAKTYGDIVYSRLLGKDIIIINSEKVAEELLEKRSTNYSDRPSFGVEKIFGLEFNSVLMPYGDRWRFHRRLLHQTFRHEAAPRFLPMLHRKACHFLRHLLATAEELDDHVFEYSMSTILISTYDYDPASKKDELFDLVANFNSTIMTAMRPDYAITISAFPFLCHLPSWFFGMSFKKTLDAALEFVNECLERPFEYSLRRMSTCGVSPAMVHDGMQYIETKGIASEESSLRALKDAAASAFLGAQLVFFDCQILVSAFTSHNLAAGSETTTGTLMTFFLMMMMHPEVQEKAQAQIDSVVGNSRLPALEDRPFIPFVDAILREIFRHNPLAPVLLPHATVNDDVYEGFYIPKGAIIIANVWSMAHDESRYSNSHAFIPDRFLNDDGSLKPNDVDHIAFGFGRRVCVGRHFADTSVWSVMTKVLAVFKILKPLDEKGVEISVEPKFTNGITVHPLPFKCRIVPRFPDMDAKKLEELIGASTA